jgi:hypothetical protein
MLLPRNKFAAHERIGKALQAAFYEMMFPELVQAINRRLWRELPTSSPASGRSAHWPCR